MAEPRSFIPGLPEYETIQLSFELPYEDAFAKDNLASLKQDKLYWFKDTRILAYSTGEFLGGAQKYSNIDEHGHGTALASLVMRANPEAVILMVEAGRSHLAIQWAVQQTWTDVLSISIGSFNLPSEFVGGDAGRVESLKDAATMGKMVVAAVGNEIIPPHLGTYAGPPWAIGVGGVVRETQGESLFSGKTPDFVSEFGARLASKETTEDKWWDGSGTSFSAPLLAGVVSRAIYEIRAEWGHLGGITDGALALSGDGRKITNADVRLALNRTATYWLPSDYSLPPDPAACPTCTVARTSVPIAPEIPGTPVGPWLQMGWGFVNESTGPQLVRVLLGKETLPQKPDGAMLFMHELYEARKAYWNGPRPL